MENVRSHGDNQKRSQVLYITKKKVVAYLWISLLIKKFVYVLTIRCVIQDFLLIKVSYHRFVFDPYFMLLKFLNKILHFSHVLNIPNVAGKWDIYHQRCSMKHYLRKLMKTVTNRCTKFQVFLSPEPLHEDKCPSTS